MPDELRLRGHARRRSGPHPLGELPNSLAIEIGKRIVHRLAVGHADITGDDFGGIFAAAINGEHRGKPLGVSDVTWNGCAWSVKTMQAFYPADCAGYFRAQFARVFSRHPRPLRRCPSHRGRGSKRLECPYKRVFA